MKIFKEVFSVIKNLPSRIDEIGAIGAVCVIVVLVALIGGHYATKVDEVFPLKAKVISVNQIQKERGGIETHYTFELFDERSRTWKPTETIWTLRCGDVVLNEYRTIRLHWIKSAIVRPYLEVDGIQVFCSKSF